MCRSITWGAAASQWGFFYATGGDLEWSDASSFANDEGLQVLLSGSTPVLTSSVVILLVAWFARNALYKGVGDAASGTLALALAGYQELRNAHRDLIPSSDPEYDLDGDTECTESQGDSLETQSWTNEDAEKPFNTPYKRRASCGVTAWVVTLVIATWVFCAAVMRPVRPYRHISATLPVLLFDALHGGPDICAERDAVAHNQWPLPGLLNETYWQERDGDFKGWAPGHGSHLAIQYRERKTEWYPWPAPNGFTRWDPRRFDKGFLESIHNSKGKPKEEDDHKKGKKGGHHHGHHGKDRKDRHKEVCHAVMKVKDSFYNPVTDPLKITNLDTDVLPAIKEAIDNGSVKIKHVVFILMESLREELFPIQQGSDIHRFIMESNEEEARNEINRLVSHMTPNIERITGKKGNFLDLDGNPFAPAEHREWNDTTEEGFGGINIVGAFTPSSVSTKSIAATHCGVWPMPVEMFEEAETDSYQPCLPQIFSLFNQIKGEQDFASEDFRQQKWHTGFFQAVTDTYDRQNVFDKKMGYENTVARTRIKKDSRYDPSLKEINYFGFADTALRSYVNGFISNVTERNERMFLSHFTSTTHHPWATPDEFNTTTYMGKVPKKRIHRDMNKYLNTIRFHDAWMGELMQIFDDHGISNETLVVFAGDHGQAFREDTDVTGTYENGHVSNFRIPITFRHPHLPRYQYEANATSVSVLPTILDLLINTGSLNGNDSRIASDIVHEYQGQSLIRPYKTSQDGRRAWNFGIVNSGGGMLTVTSADAPWRLVMPLEKDVSYSLTDLRADPLELAPITDWSLDGLANAVGTEFGDEAKQWATEAEAVAKWFSLESRRLWRYHSGNETQS